MRVSPVCSGNSRAGSGVSNRRCGQTDGARPGRASEVFERILAFTLSEMESYRRF